MSTSPIKKLSIKKVETDETDFVDLGAIEHPSQSTIEVNMIIILILQKYLMQLQEENRVEADKKVKNNNRFRIKAIHDAIQNISDYDQPITSGYMAKENIKGIGQGIADRIDEILETGGLKELQENVSEEAQAI